MESIRLEVLGMGAGVRSGPGVTRNLDEARRIADGLAGALKSRAMAGPIPELDRT